MAPAPGHVIAGKYRLERTLGEGATGTVWRALQQGLERPVAIKLMHAQIAEQEDAKVRFEREARVAASLDHPSSVAVLDFGEDAGLLYMVMELVTGETLRARLAEAPIPLGEAIAIVRQIAMALAAAHRIRLVHRDIKPENVILSQDGTAKVVDFGIAFVVDPLDAPKLGRMTADGMIVGTPMYMSPEQVRGAAMGPPSDIYSLGCVFYELIARRPPFTGALGEIFARHAYAPAIPLRQLALPEAPPPAVDELIQAMLSKSSTSRPSASRVVQLLAGYEGPADARIGRTSRPVIERTKRAFPRPPSQEVLEDEQVEVGVIGEVDPELALALAAAHITVVRTDARVMWIADGSTERAAELAAAGTHVVVRLATRDASLLPGLIRAGITDAIADPIDPDDLIRRLWRAHRTRSDVA